MSKFESITWTALLLSTHRTHRTISGGCPAASAFHRHPWSDLLLLDIKLRAVFIREMDRL